MTQNEIVVGLDDLSLRCAGSFDAEDSRSRSTNTTPITEITHPLTRPQRSIDNDEPNRICSAARVPPRGPVDDHSRCEPQRCSACKSRCQYTSNPSMPYTSRRASWTDRPFRARAS